MKFLNFTLLLHGVGEKKKTKFVASALISREENKVEFLERQFHSEKLSFVHKNELSLSICAFYRRTFNLDMQNFSLKSHHMMNARQPFC